MAHFEQEVPSNGDPLSDSGRKLTFSSDHATLRFQGRFSNTFVIETDELL